MWKVESICEALLAGALLLANTQIQFRGENLRNGGLVHDLLVASVALALMFFSTGYLLTTMLVRLFLNPATKFL